MDARKFAAVSFSIAVVLLTVTAVKGDIPRIIRILSYYIILIIRYFNHSY